VNDVQKNYRQADSGGKFGTLRLGLASQELTMTHSMRCFLAGCLVAIAALLTWPAKAEAPKPAAAAGKLALRLADGGLHIDAGSMGEFTLTYPAPASNPNQPYKLIEKSIAGNKAALKYEGGGQMELTLGADGTVALSVASMPADVKALRSEMLINFNYSEGGTWRIAGGEEKPFPKEKPPKPFLFQGNADRFVLKNYEGRTITINIPQWSYIQLQDNREWNWNIFAFWFAAPYDKNVKAYQIKITSGASGGAGPKVLVDKFGQSATADYPGKVKSVEELKADAEAEKQWLATLNPPATDAFGGLPGSGEKLGLKKTGFFHVERKDGRDILVDPEGNAFFHLGICGFGPSDDYTYIEGREQAYEWLPSHDGGFKTAYHPDQYWSPRALSFHLVNTIRKTGKPYAADEYQAAMIQRVRKWGFNSGGAFSPTFRQAQKDASFPYVGHLPFSVWEGLPAIPGVSGAWDPFDEQNRQKVDKLLADKIAPHAADPLLIGYFLVNEPLYEDLPKVIPTLNGKFACKQRLAQALREKYKTVEAFNQAWAAQAKSLDELADRGLSTATKEAAQDVRDFTGLFLEEYFRLVSETFRKYDKNHLLIGNRFQSGTINNEQLCLISGKYMDVVSLNYYTRYLDKDFLNRIHSWTGKPMFLSEFYFSSPKDSGLGGGGSVSSQEERGLAYRNYVEQAASLGYILGIEWFTLVDQSVTGRFFEKYNGENTNTGLISVADRPWKAMLSHMLKTNYEIYDVFFGKRRPFVYDDPRFNRAAGAKQAVTIPRATGEIKLNGVAEHWPGTPAEQISSQRLVVGPSAGGVECAFKLCWDDKNLYLLANVSDPTPMLNEHKGAMVWSGDGIELFIGHENLDQGGTLLFSDRQVLLSAGKPGGECQWFFANSPRQYECKMFVAANVDGKGYTLEAAVPFEGLGFQPKEGAEMRFDIGIDDSENGTGRVRQLMWNGGERNSGDRTGWGRAVFAK